MPKPLQKRGRRMKRKHEDTPDDQPPEASPKRQKPNGALHQPDDEYGKRFHTKDEEMASADPAPETAFFGVLDDQEQEYFKDADAKLELNDFSHPEDRDLFLQSIHREVEGKELKLAQSQSCSRVLERLIRLSNASQLKKIFQKFSGNFIHLLSHRFASHCCETLFTYAAPCVSDELKGKQEVVGPDEVYVSMENLFLHALAELEGSVGFLLTERYASHALRLLLLVLSGEPISTDSMKTLLRSKRKEGIASSAAGKSSEETTRKSRPVPRSFSAALEKLIGDSVAGLDTAKLRGLATHPNANPTLQLLLTVELTHYGKSRGKEAKSILRTLLPDEPFTADTESAAFVSGLVYDPVGSHLVEKIIEHAPAKLFKSMYKAFFKERLASYARNEVATHVVCRIVERLGYDDLLEAHDTLVPVIPTLLARHWTAMTRTLIERCTVRDIDTQAIAVQIELFYSGEKGFDIANMLGIDGAPQSEPNGGIPRTTNGSARSEPAAEHGANFQSAKVHFNLLAQAMVLVPGSLSELALNALIALAPATLLRMAQDHIISRTLQQALTTQHASMIVRRKLIQRFYGNIGDMALHKSASHVVDSIWEGTYGLAFIRERIAEELAENEATLRESASGRAVWKNWKMDVYKRKRNEWIRQSRIQASNDGFQSFSELEVNKKTDEAPRKTPLQMARERHVQSKVKQVKKEQDQERKEKKEKKEKREREKKERKEEMEEKEKKEEEKGKRTSRHSAGPSRSSRSRNVNATTVTTATAAASS